jgi:GT2 family glycosyltransferase/glycosyltransferase involved in cell wall biosynthesis
MALAAKPLERSWAASRLVQSPGGLEVVDVFDGRTTPDEAVGSACASFLNPGGAAQAYFRVSRPHRFTSRPIEVEIEILADSEDEIHLDYDSLDASIRVVPSYPGGFKATPLQHLQPTGSWRDIRFSIDDGRFCRGAHGADFRVVSSRPAGVPLRIRRVRLSVRGGGERTAPKPDLSNLAFNAAPNPRVSIVIPTRNGVDRICDCLWGLRGSTTDPYEIVVIDNGSVDGTREALRSIPGLRLLDLGEDLGFARACNAGAAAARAENLLFLDDGIVPLTGWLASLLAALDHDPRTGIAGSRLLDPDSGLVQHAGAELDSGGDPRPRLRFQPANHHAAEADLFVPAVSGACLLVRRSLFRELGGFDVGFANNYADIDLCLRAREAGHRVLYRGSSVLLHHEPDCKGQSDAARARADLERFHRRHGQGRALAQGQRSARNAPLSCKEHVVIVGHLVGGHVFGAERSLLDLLAAVDRTTYDVSCVLPGADQDYLRAVTRHTTDVRVFPYSWWNRARPFDEEAVGRFEEILRRAQATLVHVNTMTILDPLLAGRRLGIPTIVHARELLDLDEELAMRFGDDVSTIVDTIHATCDFIIANSEATHRLYRKGDRSFRLYNSVDLERFDLPNEPQPGKLCVGILSDNQPRKGIAHFVELAALAARRGSDLEFVVIGPNNEQLEGLVYRARAESASPNLSFLGYVGDPVEAMRRVNVVVSLSLVGESFGRTIAEAMAARRPVIAYDWGATAELVRDGRDGFLIPHLEFAAALEPLEALAGNPERLREMGRSARQRAEDLFSPTAFASQLNGIYRRILDDRKARPPDASLSARAFGQAGAEVVRRRSMRTLSSP